MKAIQSLKELADGRVHKFGHRDVILGSWGLVQEFSDRNVVFAVEELSHTDVVLFQQLGHCAIVQQEVGESSLHELGDGDVVGLKELGGGSAKELDDGELEVLSDGDVVLSLLQEAHSVEEFGDGDVVGLLLEELGNRDIVLFQELRDGGVQELGDGHVVALLEEFSHRDVILKELGHGGVQVHVGGGGQEERCRLELLLAVAMSIDLTIMISRLIVVELTTEAKVELLLFLLIREELVILLEGVMAGQISVLLVLNFGTVCDVFVKAGMLGCLNISELGVENTHLLLVLLAPLVFLFGLSVAQLFFSVTLLLFHDMSTFLLTVLSFLFLVEALLFTLARLFVAATDEVSSITLLTGEMATMGGVSAVVSRGGVLTVVLTAVMVLSELLVDVLLIQDLMVEVRVDSPSMLVLVVHVTIHVAVMVVIGVLAVAIAIGVLLVSGETLMLVAVSMRVCVVLSMATLVVEIMVPVRVHTFAHVASLGVVRTHSVVVVPAVMLGVAGGGVTLGHVSSLMSWLVSQVALKCVAGLVDVITTLVLVSATHVLPSHVVRDSSVLHKLGDRDISIVLHEFGH